MSTVHETCACGARFDYESNNTWSADANCVFAAKAWREQHRHEMPTPAKPCPGVADALRLARLTNAPRSTTAPKTGEATP